MSPIVARKRDRELRIIPGSALFIRYAVAITVCAVLALTGCGNANQGSPASTNKHPATAHSQSCADQVHTWVQNQGLAPSYRIDRDIAAMAKDAKKPMTAELLGGGSGTATELAAWQADAIALERDAQAAASNPPPACAYAADYVAGMQDYTTAAKDTLSAINDFRSGNTTAGFAQLNASTSALNRAKSALGQIGK
jgi:hypothetical protein